MSEAFIAILPAFVGAISAVSVALVTKYSKPESLTQRLKEYAETAKVIGSVIESRPAEVTSTVTMGGAGNGSINETVIQTRSETMVYDLKRFHIKQLLFEKLKTQIEADAVQRDFFGVIVGLCGVTFGLTLIMLSPWIIESAASQMKGVPLFAIIFSAGTFIALMSTWLLLLSLRKLDRTASDSASPSQSWWNKFCSWASKNYPLALIVGLTIVAFASTKNI